jgi:hypothetical protein
LDRVDPKRPQPRRIIFHDGVVHLPASARGLTFNFTRVSTRLPSLRASATRERKAASANARVAHRLRI